MQDHHNKNKMKKERNRKWQGRKGLTAESEERLRHRNYVDQLGRKPAIAVGNMMDCVEAAAGVEAGAGDFKASVVRGGEIMPPGDAVRKEIWRRAVRRGRCPTDSTKAVTGMNKATPT